MTAPVSGSPERLHGVRAADPTRVWLETRFATSMRALIVQRQVARPQIHAPELEPAAAAHADQPARDTSTAGLLADGVYRDLTVGRWTRLALASLAVVALFAAAAVSSSLVAVTVLVVLALVLLALRSLLRRPRLVVRAEGLLVVRRFGSAAVPWPRVLSAGAAPAPPPLGGVERVLAIRVAGGAELRISSLRDAIDRDTGQAPRVAELAEALVARAEWSNAPADPRR